MSDTEDSTLYRPRPAEKEDEVTQICVHAYGRLEEIAVKPLTLPALRREARRAFDLPNADMLIKGPDGQFPDSADALRNLESVYLELPDGGLHDLEQRIDQLQHMQVSYMSERLGTLTEDLATAQASIAGLTDALIEEQAFRQEFEQAVRGEIKHESNGLGAQVKKWLEHLETKLCNHFEDALHSLESRVVQDFQDLWQWTSEECRKSADGQKSLQEKVLAVKTEAPVCSKLSARIDDLCDSLVKEVQDRTAESQHLRAELLKRDERTESLRDFGEELHAAMAALQRGQLKQECPDAGAFTALKQACEELRHLAEESAADLEQKFGDMSRRLEVASTDLRQGLVQEAASRTEGEAFVDQRLAGFEAALRGEVQCRTDALRRLEDHVQAAALAMEARGARPAESAETKEPQLEQLVEESRRAADAVAAETRRREEALQQLREDCRESIQREVRSRLQDHAKLRQELEMERKTRKEAFGMIQKAMSHCGTA
ncbi:OOP [Symbiodinium natans]|uniref:OOP protein n=1 Tax=Symbiodinium natans TaxID=878477 RepID=A0A812RCC5_9DINO|nr:OOP [Symbiodinium natans]